jgi:hypothetical protein
MTDMHTSVAGPTDAELEDLLRSALVARTGQITAADLGAPRSPAELLDGRSTTGPRPARTMTGRLRWAGPAALLAAAATAGVFALNGHLLSFGSRSTSTANPTTAATSAGTTGLGPVEYVVKFTGGAGGAQKLTLSFTPHMVPLDGTKATSTYPLVVVTGGSGNLNRMVMDSVNTRLVALMDDYRARLKSSGQTKKALSQEITVRSDAQWGHDVSIVVDVIDDFGGAVPSSTSSAVIIDKRTGKAVSATDLFTDVSAADKIMRRAIRKATMPIPATSQDLAALSMAPRADGLTLPLTWYPTSTGLHWVVDRGVVASDAQGEPTATVSWAQLDSLLTPDALA